MTGLIGWLVSWLIGVAVGDSRVRVREGHPSVPGGICAHGTTQTNSPARRHLRAMTSPSQGRRRQQHPPLQPRPAQHSVIRGTGRAGAAQGCKDGVEVAAVQLKQGPVVLLIVEPLPGKPSQDCQTLGQQAIGQNHLTLC